MTPQGRGGFIPSLQALVLLACIISVTILGNSGVIDAAAVTAILGTIVGSVGVLAAVGISSRRNGNGQNGVIIQPKEGPTP